MVLANTTREQTTLVECKGHTGHANTLLHTYISQLTGS